MKVSTVPLRETRSGDALLSATPWEGLAHLPPATKEAWLQTRGTGEEAQCGAPRPGAARRQESA